MATRTRTPAAPRRRPSTPRTSSDRRARVTPLVEDDTSVLADEHAAQDAQLLDALSRMCA